MAGRGGQLDLFGVGCCRHNDHTGRGLHADRGKFEHCGPPYCFGCIHGSLREILIHPQVLPDQEIDFPASQSLPVA